MDFEIKTVTEDFMKDVVTMESQIFKKPWSRKSLDFHFFEKNTITLGAFFHNQLVGYLLANVLLDESELLRLAVLPNFRERSLASRLLNAYFKETYFCKMYFLEVEETNTNAIKLYDKFNYHIYSKRTAYYGKDNAALLMKREV